MKNLDGKEGSLIALAKWFLCRLTWKLIAQLLVMVLLGGILYGAWEARTKLLSDALNHWGQPEIVLDRLPALLDGLVNELQPDSVFVWAASAASDTRRPIMVWIKGVRRPELEGRVEPLFPDNPERMSSVVRLIHGEEFCIDFSPWSVTGKALTEAGITWMCAVGIPPDDAHLVGVITVGFANKRPDEYSAIKATLGRWARFATGKDL